MRVTKTGMILGTPASAPPEQLRGEPLDARSDIYSVGATLYFLLTGVLPFPGANAMVVLASVLQGTPTPPENHQPAIPKALSVIVLRAMARQPSERFADYAGFRAALDALSGVEFVPGRPLERVLAFPIDSALASLIGMNGTEFVSGTPWTEHHLGWRLLITWGLFLCVRAVPEAVWGTSPGKRLFGLRMQRLDGAPMSWLTSVGRSSLTFLSGGVIGALLEIVPAFAGISSRAGSAYRAPQATRLERRRQRDSPAAKGTLRPRPVREHATFSGTASENCGRHSSPGSLRWWNAVGRNDAGASQVRSLPSCMTNRLPLGARRFQTSRY